MFTQSLTELSKELATKKISSQEMTQLFLDRIDALNPTLNAFITVTAEEALAQAKAADQKIAAAKAGPLTGLPIAHKDIFCTEGIKTTCASKMLANFVSPYDATVVRKLKEAGMVILGKTNMNKFSISSSN